MAARSLFTFTPHNAETKTSTFPSPGVSSDASGARPYLAFDAAADEAVYFTFIAPQGITTPLAAIITFAMASATTGNIIADATLEAITDGDSTDTDAAESLDTANTSGATAVPATAGLIDQLSITLTNNDTITAGDYCRLRIRRVGSNGSDTATGDLLMFAVELRDDGA